MTHLDYYMLWFIGTALVILALLTVGTLAAAGILTRRGRASQAPVQRMDARVQQPAEQSSRRYDQQAA